MANYTTIQSKVSYGYAKAAAVLGPDWQHFRPSSPITPTDPSNQIGTLAAFFASEPDLKLRKPGGYKDAIRYGAFDYTQTQVGDYLVGSSGLTHFVASQDPLLVAECVECNRVLSVTRSGNNDPQAQGGPRDYGGRIVTPSPAEAASGLGDVALMTGWPASVILGTKGESAPASGRLPDSGRAPWWAIKFPACPGVALGSTDRITDDLGRAYIISAAELTDRGWNITAMEALP